VVLIDLDTAGPAAPADRPPARHARRWWGAALALAVVALATLDLRPLPDLRPIALLPPGTMRIVTAGDAFYVLRGNGSLAWNVSAYAWRDGTERWRRPLAGPDPDVVTAGAAVYVTHQQCDPQHAPSVDRLDPATGRPAWQAPGALVAGRAATGGVVLLARDTTGCGPARSATELAGVAHTDGSPQWTLHFPQPRTITAAADWFAAIAADGTTDTYTTATGTHLASGTVPPSGTAAVTAGDVLVVVTGRRLSTFDRSTLTPGWASDLNTAPSTVESCGPLLCITENAVVTAVDPLVGELRWQHPALGRSVPGPSYVIGTTDTGVRLFAWSDGRIIADLPHWQLRPAGTGPTEVALQHEDRDRVTVALADLTTGTVRTVGRLPGFQTSCITGPHRLACIDPTGTTRLWPT